MTKNTFMKYLLICFIVFLSSCKKQNFNLANLTFPISKDSLPNNIKFKEDTFFNGYILYESKDSEVMYFDGLSLSGTINNNKKSFFMTNYVSFCENIETKKIDKYEIKIRTKQQTLKFENLLIRKFGKADFHYKNEKFSYQIWEKDGAAYFFETNHTGKYNNIPFVSSNLYVVNIKNENLYQYRIVGGFQYYGDYLFAKNKEENKSKPFSYKDFVYQDKKEKEDWGDTSYYTKDYVE